MTRAGGVTSAPHKEWLKSPAWAAVSLQASQEKSSPKNRLLESSLECGQGFIDFSKHPGPSKELFVVSAPGTTRYLEDTLLSALENPETQTGEGRSPKL